MHSRLFMGVIRFLSMNLSRDYAATSVPSGTGICGFFCWWSGF